MSLISVVIVITIAIITTTIAITRNRGNSVNSRNIKFSSIKSPNLPRIITNLEDLDCSEGYMKVRGSNTLCVYIGIFQL